MMNQLLTTIDSRWMVHVNFIFRELSLCGVPLEIAEESLVRP